MHRMASVFFGIVIAVVVCSVATTVHAQVAAGTVMTECCAVVAMDNGDVYFSQYLDRVNYAQGPWTLAYNIFTAGGPRSRVVGVGGGLGAGGGTALILTSGGGIYTFGTTSGVFNGVIDHPTGESFVTIGLNCSINGRHIYAVTDAGHVYRASSNGWEAAGTLPTGPTPVSHRSWGSLKTTYR